MGAHSPILLPYGLSAEYQSFLTEDKGRAKQHGPPRFRIASLLELPELSRPHPQTLPSPAAPVTIFARNKRSRIVKSEDSDTGFQRIVRKVNMAPAISEEKHGRPRKRLKSSRSSSKSFENGSVYRRETRKTLNIGVNQRLGACQNTPITLDSDSDEFVTSADLDLSTCDARKDIPSPVHSVTSARDLNPSQYQYRNSSTRPRQGSRDVTPLQDQHASTAFALRNPPPAHALHLAMQPSFSESETPVLCESTTRRHRSPCIRPHATMEDEPREISNTYTHQHVTEWTEFAPLTSKGRPTTMRNARSSGHLSRVKFKTPGPWRYRHVWGKLEKEIEFPTTPAKLDISSTQLLGKNCVMTSGNKKDMALVDIADFDIRKKVAQLMAVAPALPIRDLYYLIIDSDGRMPKAKKRAMRMSEAPSASRTSSQPSLAKSQIHINDEHAKGAMVKIDPNDPTFQWDDDEPAPAPTSPSKARPKSNIRSKSTSYHRSRRSTKHSKASPSKRKNSRGTSSDRDFVVADNVVEYVLDSEDSGEFDSLCSTA